MLEARTRLEQLGHDVPAARVERPSHRLYELLEAEDVATAPRSPSRAATPHDELRPRRRACGTTLTSSASGASPASSAARRTSRSSRAGGSAARSLASGRVDPGRLVELYDEVEEELFRFPAVDPPSLRAAVGGLSGAVP